MHAKNIKRGKSGRSGKSGKHGKNLNRLIKSRKNIGQVGGFVGLGDMDQPSAALAKRYITPECNPETSRDLDTVFNSSPGPVGYMSGGGCGCGDEGTNTMVKSGTFGDYIKSVSSHLYDGDNSGSGSGDSLHSGGGGGVGVTTDVERMIAGMPEYHGYDSKQNPFVLLDGKGYTTNAMSGGACSSKKTKKNRKSRSKLHSKSRSKLHSKSCRKSHNKMSKMGKMSKKSKKQFGGGDFTSITRSNPADFNTVFDTPKSDLRDPVTFGTRDFGCRQPMWGPECI